MSFGTPTDGVQYGVEFGPREPEGRVNFNYGEPVKIKVEFRTWGYFTIAEFPPELKIYNEDETVVRVIPAGTESVIAQTGPPLSCEYLWDQKDNQGVQVPYGEYQMDLRDPWNGAEQVTIRDFTTSAWHGHLPHILVLPYGGSLNRVIAVHQTYTAGGWDFTIHYLVCTDTQSYLYGSLIPVIQGETKCKYNPEYRLDNEDRRHSLYFVYDGPLAYPANWFTTRFNPIPKDAESISFIITLKQTSHYRYADYEFQFDIPLS